MFLILETSSWSFMLRTGLTWRHPTDAWAYQVPLVLYLSNILLRPSVYSAKSLSSTAQSSINETGFASCFIDIIMFKPDFLISLTLDWREVSVTSITPPGFFVFFHEYPRSLINSWSFFNRTRFSSISSSANSTKSNDLGSPLTTASTVGLNISIFLASCIIVSSTSSTATGSSGTICCAASIAS